MPPIRERVESQRPFAFLVSTSSGPREIRDRIGAAAYSYYFVLEALAPSLERLGTVRLIDRPESSLAFAAERAEREGYRPIHLALNPPQDCYLTPAVPTIVFPFWEFPDLPDRSFGFDTRQNWLRVCRKADLIVTACRFTARAFETARLPCPVRVVPVPVKTDDFDIEAWNATHSWTLHCRHLTWGGKTESIASNSVSSENDESDLSLKKRVWGRAKRTYRQVYPWLSPRTVAKIARIKRLIHRIASKSKNPVDSKASLSRLVFEGVRVGYRRHVRRWLSPQAIDTVSKAKERFLTRIGRPPSIVNDPLLPAGPLNLSGLVYTSVFNLSDRRKNHLDLISAFLLAFRDREDATLVIKAATNPSREYRELAIFRQEYQNLGITDHRCRLVVITEYLDDRRMRELFRSTTYYVNASRAEGACLPLQQALASGRPAIAPKHSSMADYMDETVGFVLRFGEEPTFWPHDPERRYETRWGRLVWADLYGKFIESARIVETDPKRYRALSAAARSRMKDVASRDQTTEALRDALGALPERPSGAYSWAS